MKSMLAVLCVSLLAISHALAQGPAYPYSVALSFTASTGTVTGYNMYRAAYTTSCGAFSKLNTTLSHERLSSGCVVQHERLVRDEVPA